MDIKLTKEQYRDLIHLSVIGNCVLGILGDSFKGYKKQSVRCEELEDYLVGYAKDFDSEDLKGDYNGKPTIKGEFWEYIHEEFIDLYEVDSFRNMLVTELGKRDFKKTMTKEEKKYIDEHNGWLPDRIHDIYKSYEKEFDKNGVENMVFIKKEKK